jgi:purine nucleosidase
MQLKRSGTTMSRAVAILAAVLVALVACALATLAMPIRQWRTGESEVPVLPVVTGGPRVAMPARVWIDTDAACGHGRTTDPDDCLALLMLARSREIAIVGISTVFGNASLEVTDATTRELVEILHREGTKTGPVYRGAAQATTAAPAVTSSDADAALRQALANGPLTIVALGPLTSIASALADRPDLQRNVARLIAVMGRRPGHLFHPSEASGRGMLFGHGPVFRDFNFDQDRHAAIQVLGMRLPMTLIPYEAARQLSVSHADLAQFGAQRGSAAWVASRSRGWLAYWEEDVGRNGFYPFDLLAAVYAVRPDLLNCAEPQAWIGRDLKLWGWIYGPDALLVGQERELTTQAQAAGPVIYCQQVDSRAHEWIMSRLTGRPGA